RPSANLTLARRDPVVPVVQALQRRDVRARPNRCRDMGRETRDQVGDLGTRGVSIRIGAVVLEPRGQPALPVRSEKAQRVPALATPRVRDLAPLEDDVVERALGEEVAGGEAGVAGAYDDGGEVRRLRR